MKIAILEALFPRVCPICKSFLARTELAVCMACLQKLPVTDQAHSPQDNPLYFRLAGRVPLQGAFAQFYFDRRGMVKTLVSSLKYRKNPAVGRELGRLMGETVASAQWPDMPEALIPVPLHGKRLAQRGYNQSEAIAKGISDVLKIPILRNGLQRATFTQTQTRKGQMDRWNNVANAFECKQPLPARVALIDDVVTTGATTEACIRALLAQQQPSVALWALAMAR